jgi:hypothetical protein
MRVFARGAMTRDAMRIHVRLLTARAAPAPLERTRRRGVISRTRLWPVGSGAPPRGYTGGCTAILLVGATVENG